MNRVRTALLTAALAVAAHVLHALDVTDGVHSASLTGATATVSGGFSFSGAESFTIVYSLPDGWTYAETSGTASSGTPVFAFNDGGNELSCFFFGTPVSPLTFSFSVALPSADAEGTISGEIQYADSQGNPQPASSIGPALSVNPAPFPDLHLGWSYTGAMTEGEPQTFAPQLQNLGDGDAADITVVFRVDGRVLHTWTVPQLAANTNVVLNTPSYSWSPTGGLYTIEVAVDPENTIEEDDETNNVNTGRVTVSPAAGSWQFPIQMTGAQLADVVLGMALAGTDSFDRGLDWKSPPVAQGTGYVALASPDDDLARDFRAIAGEAEWTLVVEAGDDPIALSWDMGTVPEGGLCLLEVDANGDAVQGGVLLLMDIDSTVTIPADTTTTFAIRFPGLLVFELTLSDGWNLVSLPIEPVDSAVSAVLQGVNTGPVWSWVNDVYDMATEVTPGHGYWVYYLAPAGGGSTTIEISGLPAESTQRNLSLRWNIVGPIGVPPYGPLVLPLVTDPVNCLLEPIWGWNGTVYFDESNALQVGHGYWAYAHQPGIAELGALPRQGSGSTSGNMVLIRGGTNSGTNPLADGESYHDDWYPETYSLTVTVFYMDRHEVTKAQWDEVRAWASENGYTDLPTGGGKGDAHPVYSVNWYDCVKWCNARSEKEGRPPCYTVSGSVYRSGEVDSVVCDTSVSGYRLPTDVEWEYAARGGLTGKRFPWGDTITHSQSNYCSSSMYPYDISPTRGYHPDYDEGETPHTSPVGSFAANGYGLFDMAGNVWEWCWDWYPGAEGSSRVQRGGCWSNLAYDRRAGHRNGSRPDECIYDVGFRACVSPPGQ